MGKSLFPTTRHPDHLFRPVLLIVSPRSHSKLTLSLGWFPILFFSTVWVSEIYKASVPDAVNADAVRSGARALFFQSLVGITFYPSSWPSPASNYLKRTPTKR